MEIQRNLRNFIPQKKLAKLKHKKSLYWFKFLRVEKEEISFNINKIYITKRICEYFFVLENEKKRF